MPCKLDRINAARQKCVFTCNENREAEERENAVRISRRKLVFAQEISLAKTTLRVMTNWSRAGKASIACLPLPYEGFNELNRP